MESFNSLTKTENSTSVVERLPRLANWQVRTTFSFVYPTKLSNLSRDGRLGLCDFVDMTKGIPSQ